MFKENDIIIDDSHTLFIVINPNDYQGYSDKPTNPDEYIFYRNICDGGDYYGHSHGFELFQISPKEHNVLGKFISHYSDDESEDEAKILLIYHEDINDNNNTWEATNYLWISRADVEYRSRPASDDEIKEFLEQENMEYLIGTTLFQPSQSMFPIF